MEEGKREGRGKKKEVWKSLKERGRNTERKSLYAVSAENSLRLIACRLSGFSLALFYNLDLSIHGWLQLVYGLETDYADGASGATCFFHSTVLCICVCVLYKCLSGSTFSTNLGERVHNIGVWLVVIWISLFSNAALRLGDRHNAFHSVHSRFQLVQSTEDRVQRSKYTQSLDSRSFFQQTRSSGWYNPDRPWTMT